MARPRDKDRAAPYEAVAFAGFGTLIDRDRGLATALARATGGTDPQRLKTFADAFEPAEAARIAELEEFAGYEALLRSALRDAGEAAELALDEAALDRLVASIPQWPLYADACRALPRLAERFRLAVVTQLDVDAAERLLAPLGVELDVIVGADRVGCFRPEPDHLLALVHELELDEDQLLLAGADPDLDLHTAAGLGIPTAYLDRFGMHLPEEVEPAMTVADLDQLADRLLCGRSGPKGRPPGQRADGGDSG
jgi:2-haloalkanoic acid dehalogenase type II